MKKIIIFLGIPGSGKGTQAKKIVEKYGYGHISTGDLLRNLQKDEHAPADERQAMQEMMSGKLVADWLIYRLAFRAMDTFLDKGQGIVLDGAIRNVEQAKKYQEYFAMKHLDTEVMAIEITLSDEESFVRLGKRRVCQVCGEPVIGGTLETCPKCGGELITRKDDAEDVVKKRIQEQGNEAVAPVRDFYRSLNLLQQVNGMQSIEVVENDIEKVLNT